MTSGGFHIRQLTIVGLGLMGGSMAMAFTGLLRIRFAGLILAHQLDVMQ